MKIYSNPSSGNFLLHLIEEGLMPNGFQSIDPSIEITKDTVTVYNQDDISLFDSIGLVEAE